MGHYHTKTVSQKKENIVKTVMDVLQTCSTAVLVERHGSYLMGPVLARCANINVVLARNHARLEAESTFVLDSLGIAASKKQGSMLAEADIKIAEVVGSTNARGAGTGLYICEGYHDLSGKWVPFRCHEALNYPRYEYEDALELLQKNGDAFVAQWFNGDHADVVVDDTPDSFKGRTLGFVCDMLRAGGIRILTTHFEAAMLIHALFVAVSDLGSFDEAWTPTKDGGVIIWIDPDDSDEKKEVIKACDYGPDFQLVGAPSLSSEMIIGYTQVTSR